MSKSLLRRAAVGALLVGTAVTGTGTASAACYGTQQTATVCTANATVYKDCIYLGSGVCRPITVTGPVCVYGHIGQAYYTTVYC